MKLSPRLKKGILFSVLVAAVAFLFVLSLFFQSMCYSCAVSEKSISIARVTCLKGTDGVNRISVLIRNNDATNTVFEEDIVIAQVDGIDVVENPITLLPSDEKIIITNYNCLSTCNSGNHSVRVGTLTGVAVEEVRC